MNFYIAATIEVNGKFYAHGVRISDNDNIVSKLEIDGLKFAMICKTKKHMYELVNAWNKSYEANGSNLYQWTYYADDMEVSK